MKSQEQGKNTRSKTSARRNSTSDSRVRWLVLTLVSLTLGANYYCYDTFSSIKDHLINTLSLSESEYGVIVGAYAFPNTFLGIAILGGILLDRIGIRKMGLLFTFLCFLGMALTAYSASDYFRAGGLGSIFLGSFLASHSTEIKAMVLGRFLFGMGAETSIVVINKIIAKWFDKGRLALAFALNVVVGRLGTASVLILSPILIQSAFGWTLAAWTATVLMGLGVLAMAAHNALDKRAGKTIAGSHEDREAPFKISDLSKLVRNKAFLLITALCAFFYSAIFPFQAFCPSLLHHKFGLTPTKAGFMTSLIIWGTIAFTPLFGTLVDRRGRRASMMIGGSVVLVAAHLMLSLTSITPYPAMFSLGIAFSLVPAALWPSVPLIVQQRNLGTAYGVMASVQNLGLGVFPILAGKITDAINADALEAAAAAGVARASVTLDYSVTILMFAGLGIAGVGCAVALLRSSQGRRLEAGPLDLSKS